MPKQTDKFLLNTFIQYKHKRISLVQSKIHPFHQLEIVGFETVYVETDIPSYQVALLSDNVCEPKLIFITITRPWPSLWILLVL